MKVAFKRSFLKSIKKLKDQKAEGCHCSEY